MSRLLTILSFSKLQSWENQAHIGVFDSLSGGVRGRVIPSSIPNLEVKPPIADNTAGYACGNVGRCHFEFLTHFQLLLSTIILFIIFSLVYNHSLYFFPTYYLQLLFLYTLPYSILILY